MKKFVSGLFCVLTAGAVAIPYVNGILAEKVFSQGIQEVNTMYADTGSDLRLELIQYDRHFFSSTVMWKVTLGNMGTAYDIDEIIVTDRAKHGFTGVTSETSLEDNPWFEELVDTKLNGTTPFNISTFYSLMGDIRSTIDIHAFTTQVDGQLWTVKPARFTASTDSNFKKFTSAGSWDGLSIDDILHLKGINVNSDLTMISSIVWHGSTDFSTESISLHKEAVEVDVQGVTGKYHLDYDEENNSISTGVSYKIASVSNGLDTSKNLSAALAIKRVDADAYENAITVYMDLVTDLVDELATVQDDPEAVKDIVERKMIGVGLQMMGVYEQLLKEGLELTITDLHAELPSGNITGDAGIRLNQDITFGQIAPVLQDPARVFDFLNFHSNMSLPKEMIRDAPFLVSPFYPGMETGLFIEQGQSLVHKAETRDKKLYLNDVELQLN